MRSETNNIKSYVTGFGLSLIFTLIPYYLVTQQALSGVVLLIVIIGFAVLQMLVQVIFFLHLGREPRPRWNLLFLVNTIGIILVVVGASLWIMSHLSHSYSSPIDVTNKISQDEAVHQINGAQTGTCPGGTGSNHMVEIKSGAAMPQHTDAQLCDTLTIVDSDGASLQINFGTSDKPESYAGKTGQSLSPGRNMQIKLTELGTHKYHDQKLNSVFGDFTVAP